MIGRVAGGFVVEGEMVGTEKSQKSSSSARFVTEDEGGETGESNTWEEAARIPAATIGAASSNDGDECMAER